MSPPPPDQTTASLSDGSTASQRGAAIEVVRTLRDRGHVAYFAGGCVRDELLGLTPADYDIATDATPDRIKAIFPKSQEVGASFGVMLVRARAPHAAQASPATSIEVATFRSDGVYSDRRRPDHVTFSDPRADAERRDFTINAMFLDPLEAPTPVPTASGSAQGKIIDFVGGLADLARGVVRAVGVADQRLAEDHLRSLRAVRFAARLGFQIEESTAAAIRRHATELKGISRERIGDELRRALLHPTRAHAARLLAELALDSPVLGETGCTSSRCPDLSSPAGGPALFSILAGLDAWSQRTKFPVHFATALAAWAIDLGIASPSQATELAARWRGALCLSNDEHHMLHKLVATHQDVLHHWHDWPIAKRKRALAQEWMAQALMLCGAQESARGEALWQDRARLAASASGLAPPPLLTGDDLIAAGYRAGPRFRTVLEGVYDAQLEGRVGDREQALELARRLGVERSTPPGSPS
ncbi:MAG: CCA tRNA nucleotidyltransferase [Planctomycetota bacterium]|nr:CCA tRNA nucleotidyltransferase [Planctomycetota bacterium]